MALLIPMCIIILVFIGHMKYNNSEDSWSHNSLGSRVAIWQSATFHIQKSPLLGHEINAFQEHYLLSQKYFTPFPEWAVPTPHNVLLTLLFSGGFFSALFYLLITTKTLTHIYVSYKRAGNYLLLFQFTAVCCVLLLGIFDTPFWKIDQAFVFWTLIVSSIFLTHHINLYAQNSTQETV
jgi:O-antigen ligase